MPRATKKKETKAPEPAMYMEIFAALRMLEKERGIHVDYMVDKIKQALVNAYRKDREDHRQVPAENVIVDLTDHSMSVRQQYTVVEELEDTAMEMTLDQARNFDSAAQIGGTVYVPVDIARFGRIAAQTAKQVIIQGIREAERGAVYESYSSKTQELLTGTVLRINPQNHDMMIRIGTENGEHSDALLRASEQIPGEEYAEGDHIRVYVVDVHKASRGPMVAVSRTHPNVVRRLFELEVPEIASGLVEIRNIAREPGSRSKMAVRAMEENIDPVGACVGPRGGRVSAIVNELHGEKMDIVVWSEDLCQYVAAALAPAEVVSVTMVPGQKACRVVVPDEQLSLAIGKEGQNARLAARLTSCKIDIRPASQAVAQEQAEEELEEIAEELVEEFPEESAQA